MPFDLSALVVMLPLLLIVTVRPLPADPPSPALPPRDTSQSPPLPPLPPTLWPQIPWVLVGDIVAALVIEMMEPSPPLPPSAALPPTYMSPPCPPVPPVPWALMLG